MGMPPEMLQMMMAQQGGGQQPPMDPSMGQPGMDPAMGPQGPMGGGMPPMGGQPPMGQPPMMGDEMGGEDPSEEAFEKALDYAMQDSNIAKRLSSKKDGKETLLKMGEEIIKGYKDDEESRKDWMEMNKKWLKMAMLIRETRTFPWPRASDVKYPLLATAAMQFSARAYPALVPSDGQIVKVKVTQQNATPEIYDAARRVSNHMSYQLLNCIPNWEEDMDKLLMTMAITGVCFKKTYHSPADDCQHSHIIYPENLVINYHAKTLAKAYRKSEILHYTDQDIREKILNDEFLDVDLSSPTVDEINNKPPLAADGSPPPPDKSTPHTFIACHTFWDLDGDGYEEPYVITVHEKSKKVVRVIARWDIDGIKRSEDGKKIIKITPVEYYTDFPFIPNPDGSVYALGFGLLLGPLNESANTLINQLVDAGTLSNLQSGFIGKGLRLKIGDTTLRPGEFKVVNATGEDLSKSIYPMPVREPSNVLFQLLNMLITSGNQLASIAEIFVGKMPGQNTPATTTQETIQQGMAVFTAIYKRVYRSLTKEFKKLYRLNRISPDIVEQESKTAGIPLQASDYDLEDHQICPGADPTGDSTTVKMSKLQQVGQLLSLQTINPMEFTKRMLEANEIPNAQELLNQPQPPQPDPVQQAKAQTEQMKQQGMQQKQQGEIAIMDKKAAMMENQAAMEQAMKAQELRHTEQMQALKEQGAQSEMRQNHLMSVIEQHFETQRKHLDLAGAEAKHRLSLQQSQQAHNQKQQQARESKPKTKG
jgi:chaperonin GroES